MFSSTIIRHFIHRFAHEWLVLCPLIALYLILMEVVMSHDIGLPLYFTLPLLGYAVVFFRLSIYRQVKRHRQQSQQESLQPNWAIIALWGVFALVCLGYTVASGSVGSILEVVVLANLGCLVIAIGYLLVIALVYLDRRLPR